MAEESIIKMNKEDKLKTVKRKASDLIEDFDLYPRASVNAQHVSEMATAIEAGAILPAIVIDKESRRIIDGVHRRRAQIKLYGDNVEVVCEERVYGDKKEMFCDAMRLNSGHGINLTTFDRAHAIGRATELKIDEELIAKSLNITIERLRGITVERSTKMTFEGRTRSIPLKRSLSHLAGMNVTPERAKVIEDIQPKIGGNSFGFYANQLIMAIENDFLNMNDPQLIEHLEKLHSLLEGLLIKQV